MLNKNKIWDVIIIGGGASGMMTGVVSSSLGKSVLLLEKNSKLGEKLKITGGGRCNITNAEFDIHNLLSNYGESKDFLYTPFSIFGVKDTFSFFEKLGLPLVVEARKRAFPETQKALDVFNVLNKKLEKNKVEIKIGCQVLKFIKNNDGNLVGVKTKQGDFFAKSFILSTGGTSHPETGSTGDGFKFLKDLGHKIEKPSPSVVPIEVSDKWVHVSSGVSLSFMKITFFLDGKKQFSKTGKVLFTHFGLSGPLILNSASHVGSLLQAGKVEAFIDVYPDTDIGSLEKRIIKIFDENKNKFFKNVIKEISPEGMTKSLELLFDFVLEKKVHSITKEERKKIVLLLKNLPIHVTNLMGYDRAVVVDGGLPLTEIDTKTMKSKLYNNLFVTGDLLNINRKSGGFGLQICWTTGYIAGSNS